MVLRKIMGIFACALIIGAASAAMAGVPELTACTATTYGGPEVPVLMNVPNGSGTAFTVAQIIDGGGIPGTVDATITVTLVDGGGSPVVNYGFEDIWLETVDGAQEYTFAACIGGTTADANTDGAGQTTFTVPLRAGGCSEQPTDVMVNGAAITGSPSLVMKHNSPDITADGEVNLSDVPEFAGDFFGGAHPFRADFQYDGLVNLSDVVKLAQSLGAQCP